MAGLALHGRVLAFQRILGLGVIETAVQSARRNSLPTTRVVAGLAALVLEASFMRISVAIVAFPERQPFITRCAGRVRGVALFALHLLVLAG